MQEVCDIFFFSTPGIGDTGMTAGSRLAPIIIPVSLDYLVLSLIFHGLTEDANESSPGDWQSNIHSTEDLSLLSRI